MTALAVIVPTRGRPENAARLETAFRDTDALNAVPVFVADRDDPELPGYRQALDEGCIHRLVVNESSGGHGLCYPLNWAARRYAEVYEAVGFMGDDHLPRTLGWEDKILDALDSLEPRIAYGNDLLQGENLPTAVFMQSRLIRVMGFMAPPVMRHLYLDNFWKELGLRLDGLRYLPEVVIEHLHPAAGKAPMDEGYARVNAASADRLDREAWLAYLELSMDNLVRRVRKEYGHGSPSAA